MSLKIFLEVVEIKTKVASVFPFLIGLLFSITYFQSVHWGYTVLFFAGMLIFDLATTAINNYMDYHKAYSDVYKHEENVIGRTGLDPKIVRNMIFIMIAFTACIGLILAIQTGWLLLILGGICCVIGIFYTYGPIPLSRMPLGEIFSGFTMGLGIFVMTVYINTFSKDIFYLAVSFSKNSFSLTGSIMAVIAVVIAALPIVFTIANIMLANNLRDLNRDIENHRYTLVFYIGRRMGIILFQLLMYGSYLMLLIGWLFGIFQWPILVVFATLPIIYKHLQAFKKALPHPSSFGYAIKNMVLFNGSYALGLILTIILHALV